MPAKVVVVGLDDDIETITKVIEKAVNEIKDDTGKEIEDLSPVLTGFFRFNWNLTYGAPSDRVRGVRTEDRRFGPPTFDLVAPWFIDSGRIYFTNAVEYAEFLDAGAPPGSQQAPQGITEPVAALIDFRFRDVA